MKLLIYILSGVITTTIILFSVAALPHHEASAFTLCRSVDSNDTALSNYDYDNRKSRAFEVNRGSTIELVMFSEGDEGEEFSLFLRGYSDENGCAQYVADIKGYLGSQTVGIDPAGQSYSDEYIWAHGFFITEGSESEQIIRQTGHEGEIGTLIIKQQRSFRFWDIEVTNLDGTNEPNDLKIFYRYY